ncbi:hypothetical protein [Streptomyces sp. NPDC059398]|uniref:hypothetical protein n=1 Tax=Streptomyces sp. NPDC059398 TaxID=3346820 RepID=UPI0036A0D688
MGPDGMRVGGVGDVEGGAAGPDSSAGFGPPEVLGASGGPSGYGGLEGHSVHSGYGSDSGPSNPTEPGGFGPPPPAAPPMPAVPPTPPTPPAPADPMRAAAVALLNLSGLGLGYLLLRRWPALAVCWAATGALLVLALPADPDGVPAGVLVAYLGVLVLAAAHGAYRALRHHIIRPPRSPVALALGLVLLAAPVGGAVLYEGARDEAAQQLLLDRLADADRLVTQAKSEDFPVARVSYGKALAAYHDLGVHHPGSRAARRVPASLHTYYETVATPFREKKYCAAVEPLAYLRTVPGTYGRKQLGALAGWPDDKLATSLYECGVTGLGTGKDVVSPTGSLGQLLTAFPASRQAAKVEPAVSSAIDKAAGELKGSAPCAANDRLKNLQGQAVGLPGKEAGVDAALTDALREDAATAGRKVQAGTYICGLDQYRKGDFGGALKTLTDFASAYRGDRNRARAQKTAIAAEIAQSEPGAGKRLPSMASGGSIPVTISNDSPDEVEILYTGPVTGSFTLKACKGCSAYSSSASAQTNACKGGRSYPERTISLPPGTSYFLHKSLNSSTTTSGSNTARIQPGYTYTECAYVVQGTGSGYTS